MQSLRGLVGTSNGPRSTAGRDNRKLAAEDAKVPLVPSNSVVSDSAQPRTVDPPSEGLVEVSSAEIAQRISVVRRGTILEELDDEVGIFRYLRDGGLWLAVLFE